MGVSRDKTYVVARQSQASIQNGASCAHVVVVGRKPGGTQSVGDVFACPGGYGSGRHGSGLGGPWRGFGVPQYDTAIFRPVGGEADYLAFAQRHGGIR